MTTYTSTDEPVIEEGEASWRGRSGFRADVISRIEHALDAVTHDAVGGNMDGMRVVSRGWLDSALRQIGREPLPEFTGHTAEVITGATLTVHAVCPRCKIAGPVAMTVDTILEQDATTSTLKLKAKAAKRTHICGQLTVPEPAPVHGQTEAFPGDDAGDPEEPEAIEMGGPAELLQLEAGDVVDADAVEIADETNAGWVDFGEGVPHANSEPAVTWSTGDDDTLPGERFDLGACPFPGCDLVAEHPGAHQTIGGAS